MKFFLESKLSRRDSLREFPLECFRLNPCVLKELLPQVIEESTPKEDPQNDRQEQANGRQDDPDDRHGSAPGIDSQDAKHDPDHAEDTPANKDP